MSSRHHVVSQGYQRFFADGERIQVRYKADGPTAISLVKNCCVVNQFSSFFDGVAWDHDQVEAKWHGVENHSLPLIRALVEQGTWTPDQAGAVMSIAALHWARSYGFMIVYERILGDTLPIAQAEFAADPALAEAFIRDHGRPPSQGEVEMLVKQLHDRLVSNKLFVLQRMIANYNLAANYLATLHIQRLTNRSTQVGFITGDTPLVISRYNGLQVGLASGLALNDADAIYLPLAPHLAVQFLLQPADPVALEPWQVQLINHQFIWRAARRQVMAHPDQGLDRALGWATGR